MIPLKQISPSSISSFDGCQMKWFLEYILKHREPSKTYNAVGTCCHSVMEAVAQSIQLRATKGKKNRTVLNKSIGEVGIKYDLDDLTQRSWDYCVAQSPHLEFTAAHRDEVFSNIEKASNHRLFPENHKRIISTEAFFDKKVNEEWAQFTTLEEGVLTPKEIKIVGVVDIVYVDQKDQVQYLDYKFGAAKDWNTKKDKTFDNLGDDIQLCLYYWAVKQDFPNEDIGTNIWYVREEKSFSMVFDDVNRQIALDKLKEVILKVRNMEKPACNYTWKCKNMCQFSKKTFSDFGLDVDLPHVQGAKFGAVNGKMCACDATNVLIDKRGIQLVIENCKNAKI